MPQLQAPTVSAALKALGLFRTSLVYSGDQSGYAEATWTGGRFPFDPGSQTWAFKLLPGVAVDDLPANFQASLEAQDTNFYIAIAGLNVTQIDGKMVGGEFIDVIRGRDWLVARLRERIFGLLANAPKVPFTTAGIDQVKSEVEAQMREGIAAGYLSPDPINESVDEPFIVTVPAIGDVSDQDKIARLLPDVAFEARLAGAIHAVKVNGVIKV